MPRNWLLKQLSNGFQIKSHGPRIKIKILSQNEIGFFEGIENPDAENHCPYKELPDKITNLTDNDKGEQI